MNTRTTMPVLSELEPERVHRPRQLVLHVTERTYQMVSDEAARRRTSKSQILRDILNAGIRTTIAKAAARAGGEG
jgi:hypothetical protein